MITITSPELWFYVGLLGLSLDFIGAIGLAFESLNLVSSWINRHFIGPYILRTFNKPAQIAIRQIENEGSIYPTDAGYGTLIKIIEQASTTSEIQPFDPNSVNRLELGKTQEVSGSPNPIFAILQDGSRKPVDDLGRVKSRRGQLAANKRDLLQDLATAAPSVVLVIGFGLQIVAFFYLNSS